MHYKRDDTYFHPLIHVLRILIILDVDIHGTKLRLDHNHQ